MKICRNRAQTFSGDLEFIKIAGECSAEELLERQNIEILTLTESC